MPFTTTALVLTSANDRFELCKIDLDDLRNDEALVEIHATGVCHTDLSCAAGILPCRYPAVLGHEGCGVVLETGSAVTHVKKGDKVILSFSYCESCPQCVSGRPAYCHTFFKRNFRGCRADGSATMKETRGGKPLFGPLFGQSSFARHTVVHRSCLVHVPSDTKLEIFAALGCGVQTGAGAVFNSLRVRAGSSLVVYGVGSVGMSAILAGKVAQASTIVAVDTHAGRLELAKKLGATHCVLSTKGQNVVQEIRGICLPNGADFAADCTGVPAVVAEMIDSLGTLGRAVTIGAPGIGSTVEVDIMSHLTFGKEYVGCNMGGGNPAEVSDAYRKRLQIKKGITDCAL